MDDNAVLGLLVSGNYITAKEAKRAEEFGKGRRGTALDFLLSEGIVTANLLGQALAEYYKVPYANLPRYPVSRAQVSLIPEETALKYKVIAYSSTPTKVWVATSDPSQKELLGALKNVFGATPFSVSFAPWEEIEPLLVHYRKPLETRFSKIVEQGKKIAPEIFDEIIGDALAFAASDIHLEPQAGEVVVRFRIDGVMREAGTLPKDLYENLVNHVKVKTSMRIDEHLAAQDGALRYSTDGVPVDLRVSVVPTLEGERVAVRVLARYIRSLNLGELGLSPEDEKLFLESAKKPFGMILAVGPTGSGKTTTLYALIRVLNQPGINIMTIEDPVEYKVGGINQIQVNPQTELTFAKGLKSIIRQDPNIVLVGEIRDQETAEIGVNAALTGHLLLSTFHANDASSAIPRLLDMGIEPFLLSSTLEFVLAQRLVRKICSTCRYTVADSSAQVEKNLPPGFAKDALRPTALYRGKGCEVCHQSGYRDRTAIFELIQVTPAIKELIIGQTPAAKIAEAARGAGAHSMFADGIKKVERGITTIEEVMRVAPA